MPKTVLVADDSASMRLAVRLLLEGRNTELSVHDAVDGVDAIETARALKSSQTDYVHSVLSRGLYST